MLKSNKSMLLLTTLEDSFLYCKMLFIIFILKMLYKLLNNNLPPIWRSELKISLDGKDIKIMMGVKFIFNKFYKLKFTLMCNKKNASSWFLK